MSDTDPDAPADPGPGHVPVLLEATLELLRPMPGEVAVDATVGGGGHARELARRVQPGGRVIGLDQDEEQLARTAERLTAEGLPFHAVAANFAGIRRVLADQNASADMVLADLGFSSAQMDDPARGFSFRADGPLDMRLDRRRGETAANLVARLPESELADLLYRYGEEPLARKIARILVRAREVQPIGTTSGLARLVEEAYGRRKHASRMHPATRTFMALRVAVNDELGALTALLDQVAHAAVAKEGWLTPHARVAVISFHSLEDRLVKHGFRDLAQRGLATLLTRKPVVAGPDERARNPRARSAKLRAIRLGLSEVSA